MLQDLQTKLESHLQPGEYSVIGPANFDLFDSFMRTANNLAPAVSEIRKMEDFLNNKQAILGAIASLPPGTDLELYVIRNVPDDDIFLHETFDRYCTKNNIQL